MRDAMPELGVEARIGVNTGEVVKGTEGRGLGPDAHKKFAEPVSLSSTLPGDFPLPRNAARCGFNLIAIRTRRDSILATRLWPASRAAV